jgi:hypothetical protein
MRRTARLHGLIGIFICGLFVVGRPGGLPTDAKRPFEGVAFSFSADHMEINKTIPNVSLSITTSGRPVFVAIVPQTPGRGPDFQPYAISLGGISQKQPFSNWTITIIRDSTFAVTSGISNSMISHSDPSSVELPLSINAFDSPEAGNHVYTIRVSGAQGEIEIKGAQLVAYEL